MPEISAYLQPGLPATKKTPKGPDGHHVYVVDNEGQVFHWYAQDGGEWSLVQLPPAPIPATG